MIYNSLTNERNDRMLQTVKTKDEVLTRADVRFSLETGLQNSDYRQFRVKILEETDEVVEYKVFKFHKVSGLDSFDCNITIKTKTFTLDKTDTKALTKHIRKVYVIDNLGTDEEDIINYEYYVLDVKALIDNLDKFYDEYYELSEFIELFNASQELLFDSLDLKVFRD